jgi:hypothetical protein
MVFWPCTTGDVLKKKRAVVLPLMSVAEFAGVPFTVKSLGWTVPGSTDSLTLISKTVGCVLITLLQDGRLEITEQPVGVGVGVGLRGTVAVGVAVAVAVGVTVGVNVAVAVAVAVDVGVAVAVAVAVGVRVAVGVDVDVAVAVAVGVDVGVGDPVGSLKAYTLLSAPK